MPQTTSQINACDAVISLDNGAGLLVDISGSSNRAAMDLTNQLGVMYTFGSRFPVRQECKSDATINLRAVYSQDDAEATEILLDWYFTTRGAKTLRLEVPDALTGGDRFEFEVFLESLSAPFESDNADPIPVECVLKPTGTFTRTVIAS